MLKSNLKRFHRFRIRRSTSTIDFNLNPAFTAEDSLMQPIDRFENTFFCCKVGKTLY